MDDARGRATPEGSGAQSPGAERHLTDYLAAVASGEPTPGGGSVVAVVGALAAALGEMVCNLSRGRSADAVAEPEVRDAAEQLSGLRERLTGAAAADEAAYRRYRAAASLPKGTETERAERLAALQLALVDAADVPLAVATACAAVAAALEPVARLGNRHALSDAVTGALLAEAALRGALLNVRGNAALLRDAAVAEAYRCRAEATEAAGRAAAARVLAAAAARGTR